MKLVSGLLGAFVGYAFGTGLAMAGIVSILSFSPAIFCALAVGVILAIAI